MRIRRSTARLGLCITGALLGCLASTDAVAEGTTRTTDEMVPLKVGKACPSFAGWSMDNEPISLRETIKPAKTIPANAVVISFFATWCESCKKRLPDIQKVAREFKDKTVRVLLVDFGEGSDAAKPFLESNHFELPTIMDPFEKIGARLGVTKKLPRTFVVDGDGYVRTIFAFEGDDFQSVLRREIEAALKPLPK